MLVYGDVAKPDVQTGQVLIKVETTNVNFADVHTRRGTYRRGETVPFIPGLEATGTVVAVGDGVTDLQVGQRVAAFAAQGSYSEFMLAQAGLTYPLPEEVSFEAAAGLTAAVTAENVLNLVGKFEVSDTVLIHAAAGGVGSLCVQLAAIYGAEQIIATAGSDEKVAVALKLGAHHAINYSHENFAERVYDLTEARGADLILDAVGGDVSTKSVGCLADFGRLVVFGQASGMPGIIRTGELYKMNKCVLGYSSGHFRKVHPEALQPVAQKVLAHIQKKVLHIIVGAKFALSDAAEAHRLIESRQVIGKVLLSP